MDDLSFEWDPRKDALNHRKHGVPFREAMTVFYDEDALLLDDHAHSHEEERFLLLGMSGRLRLLVVCHCERHGQTIRIISARPATRRERGQYGQRWKR